MTNSDMSDSSELHVTTNLDAGMQLPTDFDFNSDSASLFSGFEEQDLKRTNFDMSINLMFFLTFRAVNMT